MVTVSFQAPDNYPHLLGTPPEQLLLTSSMTDIFSETMRWMTIFCEALDCSRLSFTVARV